MKKSFIKNEQVVLEYNNLINTKNIHLKKNSKILVTGCTGFIGTYLSSFLIYISERKKLNLKIFLTYRDKSKVLKKFSKFKKNKNIKFINLNNNIKILEKKKINTIFHCATYANPSVFRNKFLDVYNANINLTFRLCEILKKNKSAKLIYMSSSEVYGDTKRIKISENEYGVIDPMQTKSCYALSKQVAENILINYHKKYQLKVRIIRLFHVIGFNSDATDNRLFFDLMINFLNKKNFIKIYSDPKVKSSYCYISDVINALFVVLHKGFDGQTYNVGNPKNLVTIKNLTKLISKATNVKKKIKYIKLINKNFNPKSNYYPNLSKINKLGWKPEVNLSKSIKKITQYYKER